MQKYLWSMSNKQLSVYVSQDKDNYNANNKDIYKLF